MAELLTRLSSLTPPENPSPASDETYDREIRDLIAYIKQPSRASSIASTREQLLGVSDNSPPKFAMRGLESWAVKIIKVALAEAMLITMKKLEPSTHSLSYLLVLNTYVQPLRDRNRTHLPGDIRPGGFFWNKAVRLLACFDPIQIRYAGYEWRLLLEVIAEAAQEVSKPFLAVPVISRALSRLDSSSEVFTSVHLLVVRLALLSRSYSHVLPILDRQPYHFPTISGQVHERYHCPLLCSNNVSSTVFITDASGFSAKLTYEDHLQYFVLGAMIYLALKKWDKAIHFLSVAISTPTTSAVSKVMVEAYKKRILAGLLAYGKVIGPPKIISSHVLRVYQSLAKPYESVADAFEKGDFRRLASEIEIAQSVWHSDNNVGLVSQVLSEFDRGMIMKLRGRFSALPMADISKQATTSMEPGSTGIERFVASLVMSGNLNATLLHSPGPDPYTMLRLSPVTLTPMLQEREVKAKLLEEIHALEVAACNANSANRGLELGDEHLRFLQRSQRWTDEVDKGQTVSPGMGSNSYDVDEDIMGDIR